MILENGATAMIALMAGVLMVDGDLHEKEIELLAKTGAAFDVSEDDFKQVINMVMADAPTTVATAATMISDPQARQFVLMGMMTMAMADGDIHSSEEALINVVANAWEINL